MKKTSNFKAQILSKLRHSKWLTFTLLILIVPIYIILTPIGRISASDFVTVADLSENMNIFREGKINQPEILITEKQFDQNNPDEILRKLKQVNIGYSVSEWAIKEWLENSDHRYLNVSLECINILKNKRLKIRGYDPNDKYGNVAAFLDVIFYYYKKVLKVTELSPDPQIDQQSLKKAIIMAYNNRYGTDFKSLEKIIERR